MIYKTIKLEENLTLLEAFAKARKILKELIQENETENEFIIYIDGKTVSDLFIVKDKSIRKCTNKEWKEFFKTVLF